MDNAADQPRTFQIGDFVKKRGQKGQWHGKIVGSYSTDITPEGYAVESVFEEGSVQIYPVSALEPWEPADKPAQVRKVTKVDEAIKYFETGSHCVYDEPYLKTLIEAARQYAIIAKLKGE